MGCVTWAKGLCTGHTDELSQNGKRVVKPFSVYSVDLLSGNHETWLVLLVVGQLLK